MISEEARRLKELFSASALVHGLWYPDRPEGSQAETVKGPALEQDFQDHIDGKVGVGAVPIRADGTCRFGGIDVDLNTIDHGGLAAEVAHRKLPLFVCRSKSGGAHLYVFVDEPGIQAAELRAILKRWTTLLRHPKAEVFPKQTHVSAKNLGNWINLPYFAGDRTTRYAVGPDGRALSLGEFLAAAKPWDRTVEVDESTADGDDLLAGMPPCLKAVHEKPILEGIRNQITFNVGVYYRKRKRPNWEEDMDVFNSERLYPPLRPRELATIKRSVAAHTYQYTCFQEPLLSLCNRQECVQSPYGVGCKPWETEVGRLPVFQPTRLRKVMSEPPIYYLDVGDRELKLTDDDLMSVGKIRRAALHRLEVMLAPMSQGKWELMLSELLTKVEHIAAPLDAGREGMVAAGIEEFCGLIRRVHERNDLLRGLPIKEFIDRKTKPRQVILFRFGDLLRFLQSRKLDLWLRPSELYDLVRTRYCGGNMKLDIKGKKFEVWFIPIEQVSLEQEEFETPGAVSPEKEGKL